MIGGVKEPRVRTAAGNINPTCSLDKALKKEGAVMHKWLLLLKLLKSQLKCRLTCSSLHIFFFFTITCLKTLQIGSKLF